MFGAPDCFGRWRLRRVAGDGLQARRLCAELVLCAALVFCTVSAAVGGEAPLPVVELTAFKDGHALVVREGTIAVQQKETAGEPVEEVLLEGLPSPLLGSFWPYATDEGRRVVSATATQIASQGAREVGGVSELLQQNVGAEVVGYLRSDDQWQAVSGTIVQANNGLLVLKLPGGSVRALPLESVREVSLAGEDGIERTIKTTSTATGLRLRLGDETDAPPGKKKANDKGNGKANDKANKTANKTAGDEAGIGLLYVEKGFRWIPQYRVTLGEEGQAEYVLRATLVNDLIDLRDSRVNLVVGVPMFAFAGQTDPIALAANVEQAIEALSFGWRPRGLQAQTHLMRNSAMDFDSDGLVAEAAPSVQLGAATKAEDLFVFTVDHVTLQKGERMSIELARGTLEYEHQYAVTLPVLPPREIAAARNNQAKFEQVARRLERPEVEHDLRLRNTTKQPFTTAPVLLLQAAGEGQRERVLAQAMMSYTAPGGQSSVSLGKAIDVAVSLEEEETGRQGGVRVHGGDRFDRVDLAGTISVQNRRGTPITIKVRRYVPGPLASVSEGGTKSTLSPFETESGSPMDVGSWWLGYRPNWYAALNPTSRAEWTLEVPQSGTETVSYEWHYFWRW